MSCCFVNRFRPEEQYGVLLSKYQPQTSFLLLIKYFIMFGFAGKHISKNITKCSCFDFVKNNDTLFIDFEGVFMPRSTGNK
jgi:hypothetical protein